MKILFKIPYLFTNMLVLGLAISACNKANVVVSSKEGTIYMPAAVKSSSLALILADTAQTVSFGAAYGGLKYPGQDVTVGFKVDATLVSGYNAVHGTHYVILPSASYQIPSATAVIKAGQTSSNTLAIKVITTSLDKSIKYIIPVSISSVTTGFIDSTLGTTYFTVDTIRRLEKDITSLAALTVKVENSGGSSANEGSPKLVDGNYTTKFLVGGFPQAFWVNLAYPSPQKIGAYTITSGNDSPDRDLKDWNLSASTDGNTWTVLDTHTGETFNGRNLTKRYEFVNTTAYTQYRINVIHNNGSDAVQISEWRLITFP